ncbi:hypothetical protein VPNG_08721 [Cytospora leucostoma]|uniref:Vegetatible incompatibility protein HET-E-1 n=1 Tax=Cytospora leucostoma TaxID=1230097 RepID=A0A423W2C3_9PEZI|nr:hypothetical protein VPNG_08721 [Cytospora leucostoma]
MTTIEDFSTRRLGNLKRNQELLEGLGVVAQAEKFHRSGPRPVEQSGEPAAKRRRTGKTKAATQPSRTSARIAAAPVRPGRYEDDDTDAASSGTGAKRAKKPSSGRAAYEPVQQKAESDFDMRHRKSLPGLDELQASWSSWTPVAPPPERDEMGVFHFESHPDFSPNKSPSELLREGAFGGSYFRPLYSKKLGLTISDDYLELPASWIEGLNATQYLTSPTYDAEANKFKVACGQSIEQWEENGWINHQHDVRGWFQWYCRFFMGRRCEDDERQVSRWRKCVGPSGRWRRMLLKKYMASGVREVWDDGADDDAPEVSPVMHQTCHHWAFEVTQNVLDDYWMNMR